MDAIRFDLDRSKLSVGDLRKFIAELPDDMRVLIPGYEGGLDDCRPSVENVTLRNLREASYFGPHDEDREGDDEALVFDSVDYSSFAESAI